VIGKRGKEGDRGREEEEGESLMDLISGGAYGGSGSASAGQENILPQAMKGKKGKK